MGSRGLPHAGDGDAELARRGEPASGDGSVSVGDGTLLMYAGCPQYVDDVGRGWLTADEEREILEKLPPFDPITARSDRSNGALLELLRTYPGTQVNAHAARFVARGRDAEHLLSGQPWNYAVGRGSVLDPFLEAGGRSSSSAAITTR